MSKDDEGAVGRKPNTIVIVLILVIDLKRVIMTVLDSDDRAGL